MGLLSEQFQAARSESLVVENQSSNSTRSSKMFGGNGVVDRFGANHYESSGSEHELNSVCLGAMVDGFIENDSDSDRFPHSRCNCTSLCDCSNFDDSLSEILQELVASTNITERILLTEVNKASERTDETCLKRRIMAHLRAGGYNAAICKSRWDHAGSFPGGDHEYIDVLFESERVLIDIDFKAQFEIARPTSSYNAVVQVLPTVFVGKADRLLQIVNILSDGVKLSLKKQGMPLPPWRKPEYMRAKWFSSYRRTTNDTVHEASVANVSRFALRDNNGWNAKFTDEMEVACDLPSSGWTRWRWTTFDVERDDH